MITWSMERYFTACELVNAALVNVQVLFTTQCCGTVMYSKTVLSACLSLLSAVSKLLDISSEVFCHLVAILFQFSHTKCNESLMAHLLQDMFVSVVAN